MNVVKYCLHHSAILLISGMKRSLKRIRSYLFNDRPKSSNVRTSAQSIITDGPRYMRGIGTPKIDSHIKRPRMTDN